MSQYSPLIRDMSEERPFVFICPIMNNWRDSQGARNVTFQMSCAIGFANVTEFFISERVFPILKKRIGQKL